MSPAVSSGWRGGRASSLFLFDSGHEFVARMSVVVCLGRRDGIASRLFLLNSGNELVAKINHVVCPGKRGGIATGLFTSTGAVNSSPGWVWRSASASPVEGPAALSASTGTLAGLAAFELRLRLRRFIFIQFYRKRWRRS